MTNTNVGDREASMVAGKAKKIKRNYKLSVIISFRVSHSKKMLGTIVEQENRESFLDRG